MTASLTAHHLRFVVQATTRISLPTESGSAIRGALISALRTHYCPDSFLRPSGYRIQDDRSHRAICPVCWLIALDDAKAERGRDIPRPYTIEPPSRTAHEYEPGAQLSFGVSVVGQAVNLFPYLVLAVPEMGRLGVGYFDLRQGGRGRFVLQSVTAVNPISGATQPLLAAGVPVQMPAIPVDRAQVVKQARSLVEGARANGDQLRLSFRSPTRIVAESRLIHRATFGPLFQRLVERVEGLVRHYCGTEVMWVSARREELLAIADKVEIVEDGTRWVDVTSRSQRLGRSTPVGGYLGEVIYHSPDWEHLLPWLLWGQSVHVGKNAVKGDGWFTVEGCPGWTEAAGTSQATNAPAT